MPMLHRFASVPLALAASLTAQAPVVKTTAEFYPVDVQQMNGDERWLTVRVVDGVSGQPIAGAELLLIAESPNPLRGEFWSSMRTAADGDGFVRLRADAGAKGYAAWGWLLVRAKGHGSAMFFKNMNDAVVRLAPSTPVPVRVLDWRGEPVAKALLGFCGGCGHTPDLAFGRSDAKGEVQLADVDPQDEITDLYVEADGLGLGYEPLRWLPGMAPAMLRVEPCATMRGVVVDLGGKPVADAFVGTIGPHRGPWTKTAADGSFALHGGDPRGDLHVHVGKRELMFPRETLGSTIRLQLPQPDGKKPQRVGAGGRGAETGELVLVKVSVKDGAGASLAGGAFRFVGPLPKHDTTAGAVDGDDAAAFLLPGRYELWAEANDHASTMQPVEVTKAEDQAIVARPVALPRRAVQVQRLADGGSVWLRTATVRREITDEVRNGAPIGLPDEPCRIVVQGEGKQCRVFAQERGAGKLTAPLVLSWWPPTQIVGKVVDAAGKPCAAEIAFVPVERSVVGFDPRASMDTKLVQGAIDLPSELDGLAFLVVRDPAGAASPQSVPVLLPPRGENVRADVGTVVLGGKPAVVVMAADGSPLAGEVGFVRAGWHNVRQGAPQFPLAADGSLLGPRPAAGDALFVPEQQAGEVEGATAIDLSVRFTLAGAGPWKLTLPAGEVLLDVKGPAGDPVTGAVVVGEHHHRFDGKLRLRRVPPGPQRLFVAAEGFQSAVVDAVVPAKGAVAVQVTLPVR